MTGQKRQQDPRGKNDTQNFVQRKSYRQQQDTTTSAAISELQASCNYTRSNSLSHTNVTGYLIQTLENTENYEASDKFQGNTSGNNDSVKRCRGLNNQTRSYSSPSSSEEGNLSKKIAPTWSAVGNSC